MMKRKRPAKQKENTKKLVNKNTLTLFYKKTKFWVSEIN